MPDTFRPTRRTTRSMSREQSPVSVSPTGDGGVPRSQPKRRVVPNANSFAYGSQGRTPLPSQLNPDLADMNPVDAVRAAVEIADARPIVSLAEVLGSLDDLSAIPEDDEEIHPGSDLYDVEKEYSMDHVSDHSSDNEKEDDRAYASRFGHTETAVHGPGNKFPKADKRDSRSFGTEDPIFGVGKSAQAKTGSIVSTGQSSSTLKGDSAQVINQHVSRDDSDLTHQEHERIGPSRLTMNILRFIVVFLILYTFYQAALRFPQFNSLRNMSKTAELAARPMPTLYDQQISNLMDRLKKVEDSLNVLPTQYVQPEPARINFFSPGVGAMVDPHLTSPSNKHTYKARAWHHWGMGKYNGKTPGPADALAPWADVGDCWCAAPSGGKAQLTVLLPHRVIPTHLVVEHVQKGLTLGIGAAPKDLELWVQILDDDQRDSVQAGANAFLQHGSEDSTDRTDNFQAEKSLDRTWVRIANFRYDIDAPQHIQTFKIDVQLDNWGLAANKVAIRVKDNWGPSDFTCLYRLKLHGHLAEPPRDEYAPEYLREQRERRQRSSLR